MAEAPTFKVQIDYQKPENVEAEVPGSQEIREVDTGSVSEATEDYTLSPVITVTKNEATFKKGDLKLQKVTVTEDIAMDEIQNGGQSQITRTYQSVRSDGNTITRTTSTTESYQEHSAVDDKHREERKSKIPTLKFKQTVEKIKRDKTLRKKQEDEVAKRPRKSSIPKLSKETKMAIKKHETAKELAPEDEFEKIYEQMADEQVVDDKVLAVKVEDPEKLDSKFEELMHSYEEDDNASVLQVEKLRQSKIPALRRRKVEGDANKMSSIVNNIRLQNAVRNSREFPIEDEYGAITTKTITTKRFDRVNSRDATTAAGAYDDPNNNTEVLTTTRIIKQTSRTATPLVTTLSRTEKATKVDDTNVETEITTLDEYNSPNDNSKEVRKRTRIVRQGSRIAAPMVTTVTRTENLAKADNNNDEDKEVTTVVKAYDESNNTSKEATITTRVIKEITKIASPVIITRTEKATKMEVDENNVQEVRTTVDVSNDYNVNNKEVRKTTRIIKESSRIASPVVTTVTRTEKVVKEDANDDHIKEETVDIDNNKAVTITTQVLRQSSKITPPAVTTVTRTEKVTKMDTNADTTDISQGVTTRRVVTKHTIVPKVTNVTDTETIVVDTADNIVTDISDTARSIARQGIIKEISKVTPVIDKVEVGAGDKTPEDISVAKTVVSGNFNNDITHGYVTKTQEVIENNKVGLPVQSMEKSIKVITTTISVNSDNKKVETDTFKESSKIDSAKQTSTKIDTDHIAKDIATKGVMTTEQIVREGIRIGIPVFTKVTDESSVATGIIVNNDKKEEREYKEKDSIKMTQVTRTISQEKVQNVEMGKVLDWKADKEGIRPKTFDDKNVEPESIKKIDMSRTFVTNKINKLETKYTPSEGKLTERNIGVTDKDVANSTSMKETTQIIDATNQRALEDVEIQEQDKTSNVEDVTILKGNVSRLINKLGSRENREVNKDDLSNDDIEIDIVNQERIKRLDKMISEFNKVGIKDVDTKESKEPLSKREIENSVVLTQDRYGEDVTILRGNVSRLVNRLGAKETEIITNRGTIIDVSNNIGDKVTKFDEKSNQKYTEQDQYNIKQINTGAVVTVIKKETDNISDITHTKNITKVVETTKEIIENIKDDANNIGKASPKIQRADSRTKEPEEDEDTALETDNAGNETADASLLVQEKVSKEDEIIKGSVSRIITKISSQEINNTEVSSKDYENEFPKKKSVISKIAIFERLEPRESYPTARQTRSEKKITKLVRDVSISEKPRIVDELLKDHAKIDPDDVDNKDVIGMVSINETTVRKEPVIANEIWKTSFDKDSAVYNVTRQEILGFETHDDRVEIGLDDRSNTEDANDKPNDVEPSTDNMRSNMYVISNMNNVQNETTENSKQIYDRVKHKYDVYEQNAVTMSQELKRSVSREYKLKINTHTMENGATTADVKGDFQFEYPLVRDEGFNDSNEVKAVDYDAEYFKYNKPIRFGSKEDYKRARSLAETDLGDTINGNVNRMIGRIKSVDFDRGNDVMVKAEKISIKEMPRKSSVLEKIALFEGKATARFETSTSRTTRVTKKSAVHLATQEIRQERTTAQANVSTAKMDIVTELPSRVVEKPVITEEMYQAKIRELEAAKSLYQPVEVSTITLGNGMQMPVIALGTALLDPLLIPYIIGAAIDLGYRAFDTAYIYGNEKAIGDAIRTKIEDGTVKREELFIISKLWSTFHRGDLVEPACKASLTNLGLHYIDLYLIHNPMSFKEGGDPIPRIATVLQYSEHDYLDAWFAMEKLVAQGLVRSIGVSNFNSSQIQRILDKGRVKPVVNQVECHPYLSQERLDDFCRARDVTLSCFGVLGSKGTPAEYKSSLTPAIDDPLVQVMANGLNVTSAQLLIRYQIQSGHQAVVKSSSATHLKDNLDALNFTLSESQMNAIHALNRNKRIFTFIGMGETHKHYPFTAPY